MTEQLISFETAVLAKEKGFDLKCEMCFLSEENEPQPFKNPAPSMSNKIEMAYSAPTQSLLQKWLREIHAIDIWVERYNSTERFYYQCPKVHDIHPHLNHWGDTYEEALEKGLQQALKLI